MKVIYHLLIGILIAAATAFSTSASYAAWQPPESKTNDGVIVPSFTWLEMAPAAYWMVYERWPEQWQDIVDAGIITQPLYDPYGNVFQPDDQSWDFNGDVQYVYQGAATPLIMSWTSSTNATSSHPTSRCTVTWEQKLEKSVQGEKVNWLKGNKVRQRQMVICGLISEGANLFWHAYGRVPATYAELAESGLGPLVSGAVNPLTGKPYSGNGEPNDFSFDCSESEEDQALVLSITPLGEDGKKFWFGSLL